LVRHKTIPAILLALLVIATAIGCDAISHKHGKAMFQQGRDLVVTGRYRAAVPILNQYLHLHPRGKHASRAGLFLGKAYLALGDIAKAREAWSQTSQNFPTTLEGHKCRYKLALLLMLEGERDKAAAAFGQLADAPDGPLAAEATAMKKFLMEEPPPAEHTPEN